jgi:hypothetical protein
VIDDDDEKKVFWQAKQWIFIHRLLCGLQNTMGLCRATQPSRQEGKMGQQT